MLENTLTVKELTRRLEEKGVPLCAEDRDRLKHKAREHLMLHGHNNGGEQSGSEALGDVRISVQSLCDVLNIPVATNSQGNIGW